MSNKAKRIIENVKNGNNLVAVYGTLKKGDEEHSWGNHSLLQRDPVITGNIGISKLDDRGFPIIKLGDTYKLNVEVYEVDTLDLQNLDSLEGYREGQPATFYDRKTVDVTLEDGSKLNTFVYEYVSNFDNNIEDECDLEEGIYNWIGRRYH